MAFARVDRYLLFMFAAFAGITLSVVRLYQFISYTTLTATLHFCQVHYLFDKEQIIKVEIHH